MRRIGSAIACLVLLALGIGAGSASGVTTKVELRANGELLPVGAPFLATSANLKITFNAKGSVACTSTSIGGAIVWNAKTKATVSLPEGERSFSGGDLEAPERCGGTGFNVSATFPKGLYVNPTGVAEFKETHFELEAPPGHKADEGRCKLKSLSLKGTYPLSHVEPGEPLTITFTKQRLSVEANSGIECGTLGYLTMTLETSSAGNPILAAVIP